MKTQRYGFCPLPPRYETPAAFMREDSFFQSMKSDVESLVDEQRDMLDFMESDVCRVARDKAKGIEEVQGARSESGFWRRLLGPRRRKEPRGFQERDSAPPRSGPADSQERDPEPPRLHPMTTPFAILCNYAVDDYKEHRMNGIDEDSPQRPFPQDGSFIWEPTDQRPFPRDGRFTRESMDQRLFPRGGRFVWESMDYSMDYNDPEKEVFVYYNLQYQEGPGDRAWMEERDRNYIRRLAKEKQLLEVESDLDQAIASDHRYCTEILRALEAARKQARPTRFGNLFRRDRSAAVFPPPPASAEAREAEEQTRRIQEWQAAERKAREEERRKKQLLDSGAFYALDQKRRADRAEEERRQQEKERNSQPAFIREMKAYTMSGKVSRFFHGAWAHHHVQSVEGYMTTQAPPTFRGLLDYLGSQGRCLNEKGELYRRLISVNDCYHLGLRRSLQCLLDRGTFVRREGDSAAPPRPGI